MTFRSHKVTRFTYLLSLNSLQTRDIYQSLPLGVVSVRQALGDGLRQVPPTSAPLTTHEAGAANTQTSQ